MCRHYLGLARWLLPIWTFIGCGPLPGRMAFQDRFPDPESGHVVLPNGLRVFLERDPQSPVVSLGWMVPAGAASDPPGKEGLAHLTEHLIFRAPREGGTSAMDFFSQSGVRFQGQTSPDDTEFTVSVHRVRFGELLNYELARMANPLASLDAGQLAEEVRILREEEASMHPAWRPEATSSLFESLFPGGSTFIRKPESLVDDPGVGCGRQAHEAETNSSGSPPRATLSRNIWSATSCARGRRGNLSNRTTFDELLR